MKKLTAAVLCLVTLLICMTITFNSCAQTNYTGQSYRFATPSGGLGDKQDTTVFVPKPPGTIVWGNSYKHYYVGLDGFFHLLGPSSSGLTGTLTSPRIPFANSANVLMDNANFTYNSTFVTVPALNATSLTNHRITTAGASGRLTDFAEFTYSSGVNVGTLTIGNNGTVAAGLSLGSSNQSILGTDPTQAMSISQAAGNSAATFTVKGGDAISSGGNGGGLTLNSGTAIGAATGGALTIKSGNTSNGTGGSLSIQAGDATTGNGNGGAFVLSTGAGFGSGVNGDLFLRTGTPTKGGNIAVNAYGGNVDINTAGSTGNLRLATNMAAGTGLIDLRNNGTSIGNFGIDQSSSTGLHMGVSGTEINISSSVSQLYGLNPNHQLLINGATGNVSQNNAGGTLISGGDAYSVAGNGNGGDVIINSGAKRGSGIDGSIKVNPTGTGTFQVGSGGPFKVNNLGNITSTGSVNVVTQAGNDVILTATGDGLGGGQITITETGSGGGINLTTSDGITLGDGGTTNFTVSPSNIALVSAGLISIQTTTDIIYNVNSTTGAIPLLLSNSAALNFPSTTAGNASDLTITLTGAVDGDLVTLGVPNGSTLADGVFTCWVSAANTVKVRFANNSLTLALDPASGTFKVGILR